MQGENCPGRTCSESILSEGEMSCGRFAILSGIRDIRPVPKYISKSWPAKELGPAGRAGGRARGRYSGSRQTDRGAPSA